MARRILLVEDSATQAEALRAVLETAGYEVVVARSGEEGLQRLDAQGFSVVLSDIVMPGAVDGYALCRRVKESGKRDTPVVLLTSLSDPLDVIHGLECGADSFLRKPVEPDRLLGRLDVLLATRKARAQTTDAGGVKVSFMGTEFTITSGPEQILDLLVSTFEEAVRQTGDLERRERELRALNRELEAFSYSVSHDLRAPLRAIDGFSRILLQDHGPALDAEAGRLLGLVGASTEQMGRLIEGLLTFSRLGRQGMEVAPVEMGGLVKEVVAMLLAGEREPAPEVVVGPLPAARGDRTLLRQVWLNLVDNAMKYSGKQPAPRVEIGGEASDGEAVYWVRDNGVGFDMAYAEKLFGVFQRLHSPDEFEGTGVGLATVQRIVQRHGGRVWAEAVPGRGATFYFAVAAG